jgi:hypothetical protein
LWNPVSRNREDVQNVQQEGKPVTPRPKTHPKYYKQVRADQIRFDHRVQRQYDPRLANRLEADWDPEGYGTITLSKRADGHYYGVDGQHRTIVSLRKDPNAVLDAEVHEGLTLQQEAKMYLRHNRDRKASPKYEDYTVSLTAREPIQTRIEAEVTSLDLKVAATPSANQVGAVATLIDIAKKDVNGGGLVRDILTVALAAWGRRQESWDNMILRALGPVINKNRANIDLARLSNILRDMEPGNWKALAIATSRGGGGSQSRGNRLAEIIVEAYYNSRLRTETKKIRGVAERSESNQSRG